MKMFGSMVSGVGQNFATEKSPEIWDQFAINGIKIKKILGKFLIHFIKRKRDIL